MSHNKSHFFVLVPCTITRRGAQNTSANGGRRLTRVNSDSEQTLRWNIAAKGGIPSEDEQSFGKGPCFFHPFDEIVLTTPSNTL
ncbi:hypothetical protein [Burkholderia stagnalis]|uniref:hypothetical protein n=1 Tax=Burkholderia stagnalis TaxID=1503054 RepID=UPI0012DA679D|nr:hypothetical protein [Burkholderia stagnalis]